MQPSRGVRSSDTVSNMSLPKSELTDTIHLLCVPDYYPLTSRRVNSVRLWQLRWDNSTLFMHILFHMLLALRTVGNLPHWQDSAVHPLLPVVAGEALLIRHNRKRVVHLVFLPNV